MTAKAIAVREAPQEIRNYLAKLCKVCGRQEPVHIGIISAAEMPERVGVTDNPDGWLRLVPGKAPLIVITDAMLEGNRWQFIVAHEFFHLMRWTIDEFVLRRLPPHEHEIYMRLVEDLMKPLTIITMAMAVVGVEWVEGDSTL